MQGRGASLAHSVARYTPCCNIVVEAMKLSRAGEDGIGQGSVISGELDVLCRLFRWHRRPVFLAGLPRLDQVVFGGGGAEGTCLTRTRIGVS